MCGHLDGSDEKDLDNYECRHGMGYTKIFASRRYRNEYYFFVPIEFDAKFIG